MYDKLLDFTIFTILYSLFCVFAFNLLSKFFNKLRFKGLIASTVQLFTVTLVFAIIPILFFKLR